MKEMRSMFIIRNDAGLTVYLRARDEPTAVEVVATGRAMAPDGYEFKWHSIRPAQNSKRPGSSNGRRRNVKLYFSQMESRETMPVPAARAHFAPLWAASLGLAATPPNPLTSSHQSAPTSTAKS
jgi:hypothetical protein